MLRKWFVAKRLDAHKGTKKRPFVQHPLVLTFIRANLILELSSIDTCSNVCLGASFAIKEARTADESRETNRINLMEC